MQDDNLIRRAAAQDAAAFEQLMLLHQKPVYNICYRMAGNAEDALDLSQEVFLKLWRTLAQYQFDAAFSTWLQRLAGFNGYGSAGAGCAVLFHNCACPPDRRTGFLCFRRGRKDCYRSGHEQRRQNKR